MKFAVGIIGPYISKGNRRLIDHNIANARYVAIQISNYFATKNNLVGYFAPHTHTAMFEKLADAPESFYHELDDLIYDRACDGFVLLPDWKKSTGAQRDRQNALKQEKLIFELEDYGDNSMSWLLKSLEEWALEKTETQK